MIFNEFLIFRFYLFDAIVVVVMLCNAIPFIGFGLLDNGIMILAVSVILHLIYIQFLYYFFRRILSMTCRSLFKLNLFQTGWIHWSYNWINSWNFNNGWLVTNVSKQWQIGVLGRAIPSQIGIGGLRFNKILSFIFDNLL